ncbi:MAG TPA: hypothetical protein VJ861_03295, partial [Treponemataceae bacterium]|nr:hypothetical protein [Treponemataceae bacterium]
MRKNKGVTCMGKTGSKRLSAIMATLFFFVMVTVNGLANALPLNGVNTGQLSDEIPNLFVPAGITFAIWGLIYIMLLCYVIAVLIAAFGKKGSSLWDSKDGWLFSINSLLNTVWIFAWHWRMVGLSLVLMLGILASLIFLLESGFKSTEKTKLEKTDQALGEKVRDFFLWQPILVYLGWICVATIANVTALLVTVGWNGFGLPALWWTVAVIVVGTVIGILLVAKRGAVASGLVVIWAYAGIIMKRNAVDPELTMPIIIVAIAGAIAVLAVIVYKLVARRKS